MREGSEYYAQIEQTVRDSFSPAEAALVEKAYYFAYENHKGQRRRSGEAYIIHPVAVSKILLDFGMDSQSVIAALLHDVVEDTPVTAEEVHRMFGADVSLLVEGVTKLGQVPLQSREEQQAENLRKLLLAMSEDIRVICTTCARWSICRSKSAGISQKRRSRSTRPSRTGSVSGP